MLDIVDFLEQAGQDASLAHATVEELLQSPLAASLSADARDALAAASRPTGGSLATQPYCGLLFPAEEEGEGEREPEPDVDEPVRDAE